MNRRNTLSRVLFPSLILTLSLLQGCASLGPAAGKDTLLPPAAADSCTQDNRAVQSYFSVIDNIKKNRPELAQILKKFPKGGDLHNHLSGSVMPEDYLALGSAEGDCFGPDSSVPAMLTIKSATKPGVCDKGFKLLTQADSGERQLLLQSLSMYHFNDKGLTSVQAGHDQFFATFGRFAAVSGAPANLAPMLAKLLQQAHDDNVGYVETMTSFQSTAVGNLADQLRKQYPDPASFSNRNNYPNMYEYLLRAGLNDVVAAAQKDVVTYVNGVNAVLNCGSATPAPACDVSFNFQAAVNRNAAMKDGSPDLPKIFTQVVFSTVLANTEPRVVGVNLLSGEDSPVSMQTFTQQMGFFEYMTYRYLRPNIALHGGELTPCFVGADKSALKGHLTGSIQAGAKRVGHGVSFAYLSDAEKSSVAALMRQNDTLVEVPMASNAQILGVAGDDHPFVQYFRQYGIPVAFSTDDEGVSYTDYTSEWIYAVGQYRLTYDEAVRLARLSLLYSFMPGQSLWLDESTIIAPQCKGKVAGSANPGEPCKSFLAQNAKAATQWRFEGKLADFDKENGAALRKELGTEKEARR